MSKRETVKIEGYFEFTKRLPSECELEGWKKWFDSKGIKHKTVKIGRMFVLYREGAEANAKRRSQ